MIYAVIAGLALAVLGGAAFFISRSAKHKERAKAAQTGLKHAGEALEIDEDVARMSDADLDRELHDTERQ